MKKEIVKVTKNIGLHLDTIEEAFSKYSYKENFILDSGMIDFIEENAKEYAGVDLKNYEIDIYSDKKVKKEDSQKFTNSFKKYYERKLFDIHRAITKLNLYGAVFFVIGAVFLTATHLVSSIFPNAPEVISFALEIASWVFMWEAVDLVFIQKGKDRLDQVFYLNLSESIIVFKEDSKE